MTRRELFSRLAAGIGIFTAGIVGIPAITNLFAPLIGRDDSERWTSVGAVDSFAEGEVSEATVDVPQPREASQQGEEELVYVWRKTAEDIIVFSRHCTDLGCGVIWDPGSEWFFCPCHGGIFAKNGERMAGPPQRPLYQYDARVQDGVLEIDLASLPPMT